MTRIAGTSFTDEGELWERHSRKDLWDMLARTTAKLDEMEKANAPCQHNIVNIGAQAAEITIWWRPTGAAESSQYVGPIPEGLGLGEDDVLELRICTTCGVMLNFKPDVIARLPSSETTGLSRRQRASRALAVACPTCEAVPGAPCTKVYAYGHKGVKRGNHGDPTMGYFHAARHRAAREP